MRQGVGGSGQFAPPVRTPPLLPSAPDPPSGARRPPDSHGRTPVPRQTPLRRPVQPKRRRRPLRYSGTGPAWPGAVVHRVQQAVADDLKPTATGTPSRLSSASTAPRRHESGSARAASSWPRWRGCASGIAGHWATGRTRTSEPTGRPKATLIVPRPAAWK